MGKNRLRITFFYIILALVASGVFGLTQNGKFWQKTEKEIIKNETINFEKETIEIPAKETMPVFL